MKPQVSIAIFLFFAISSMLSSIECYRKAERRIVNDLNRALVLTVQEHPSEELTPDTLRTYRRHLTIDQLKTRASLAYCLHGENIDTTCSKLLPADKSAHFIGLRAYANCSMATIFSISDQRLPLSLLLVATLWGLWAVLYARKHRFDTISSRSLYGELTYSSTVSAFFNKRHEQVHFTPMQAQLMQMFLTADSHRLSQSEIFAALWPKKDDPSETLHTLIRRLKTTLESVCRLHIEVERGQAYRILKSKE
ncbi:MAG: winged helix-turn-helix domain-containing protein [Hoylesella enoeca]|uniref:winged helix-turn-helix domain-containing protein n=1 Tax=Hoylesella enoeca TaxID=76123 RepID=UPI00288ACCD3|nr:winged helix-turn-helix domain-containing protein [Hoylesella enoeca]